MEEQSGELGTGDEARENHALAVAVQIVAERTEAVKVGQAALIPAESKPHPRRFSWLLSFLEAQ